MCHAAAAAPAILMDGVNIHFGPFQSLKHVDAVRHAVGLVFQQFNGEILEGAARRPVRHGAGPPQGTGFPRSGSQPLTPTTLQGP